jgi:D-alanine-D-alanine ligase
MADTTSDLSRHLLCPTPEEVRDTRVLFHTQHATKLTPEEPLLYGYPILEALQNLGLRVTPASDPETLFGALDFDYVYLTQLESTFSGHELLVPNIAAFRGIPFLGPPAPVRALSEDKLLGKALAASLGIGVARHRLVDPRQPGISNLYPPGRWVLKPRSGVMSEHIGFVDDAASWRKAVGQAAHRMHAKREFIAEEFVPGLNLAVPVIEGFPPRAFPTFVEHGERRNNILTKSGKEGLTDDYASEPYEGPGAAEAQAAAAKLAAAIAPFDYARFDFRFEPVSNRLVFLEVNMNCAMGPLAVVALAAAERGIDHAALVGHVFTHSLRRQRKG